MFVAKIYMNVIACTEQRENYDLENTS